MRLVEVLEIARVRGSAGCCGVVDKFRRWSWIYFEDKRKNNEIDYGSMLEVMGIARERARPFRQFPRR